MMETVLNILFICLILGICFYGVYTLPLGSGLRKIAFYPLELMGYSLGREWIATINIHKENCFIRGIPCDSKLMNSLCVVIEELPDIDFYSSFGIWVSSPAHRKDISIHIHRLEDDELIGIIKTSPSALYDVDMLESKIRYIVKNDKVSKGLSAKNHPTR